MDVEVRSFNMKRRKAIEAAAKSEWRFSHKDKFGDILAFWGEDYLCAGESEEEFVERITRAIWEANGDFCKVRVRATYLEKLPFEVYELGLKEYKSFMEKKQEDKSNSGY